MTVWGQSEVIQTETTHTLQSGASFRIPAGWLKDTRGARLTLRAQDSNLWIGVFERHTSDVHAAVSQAWTGFTDGAQWPLKSSSQSPAREGWEDAHSFLYDAATDQMEASALALRYGRVWTVVLFYGSVTEFERRRAQIRLLVGSLHPQGFVTESFQGLRARELNADALEELTGFIARVRDSAGIPGVSLCLVQKGQVVYEGGFGTRDLTDPRAVDAETLFPVASNTKQFTTLFLAKLVSYGIFSWETPVTEVFPQFRLGDPEATRKIQIRHLVSACTGLPRRDLDWMFGFEGAGPQRVFDLLSTMRPTTGFGEVFQYSNLLASSAGYIGAHAAFPGEELGAAFEKAMSKYVFEPLGMDASTFDFAKARSRNHALPHGEDLSGQTRRAELDINYAACVIRPALALWSSARDLTRYLRMELSEGVLLDGARYINPGPLLKRRESMVAFDEHGSYGMGLIVNNKFGTPVIAHGGSLIGYKSNIFWLPEHKVGGAILTNSDSGGTLVHTFVRKLLEVVFNGRPEAEDDFRQTLERRRSSARVRRDQFIGENGFDLASEYHNPDLGKLCVKRDGGALIFDFGCWNSRVSARRDEAGRLSFATLRSWLGFI